MIRALMRFNNLKEDEVTSMSAYNAFIDYRFMKQENDMMEDKKTQIERIEKEKAASKNKKRG